MHSGNITVNDTKGKVIFWDIDGTLAPFRLNNSMNFLKDKNSPEVTKAAEDGLFLKRPPSKFMQKVISECGARKNIVIGQYVLEQEIDQKPEWLKMHFPQIEESYFMDTKSSKVDAILGYCLKYNIPLRDVLFVDDVVPFLQEAEFAGIESWHISSFLDWNYQFESCALETV